MPFALHRLSVPLQVSIERRPLVLLVDETIEICEISNPGEARLQYRFPWAVVPTVRYVLSK